MSLQILKREAKKLSATVEKDEGGRYCTWQIIAPDGFQWSDSGSVSLKVEWIRGDSAWRVDAIQEAIVRVGYGLEEIK